MSPAEGSGAAGPSGRGGGPRVAPGGGRLTVIGVDGAPLAPGAAAALASATLVVGGRRHLAGVALPPGARVVPLGELAPALDAIAGRRGDAVVLASGDPGFFGIVRALRERGLDPAVLPAPSSVSLAFARAGLAWDDAVVVSAHGRDPGRAVNVCRAHPKVAVLTGPGTGPAELGTALAGWDRVLVVCERLGEPGERVTECRPDQAAARDWDDPNVVLVLGDRGRDSGVLRGGVPDSGVPDSGVLRGGVPDSGVPDSGVPDGGGARVGARRAAGTSAAPGWAWPRPAVPPGWALAEGSFETAGAVATKAEVRALALARLAPGPGTLVWDVGAGAGTVAVECARFGAAVIAVERDPGRCELVRANARRHGVDVRVVEGEAPGALAGLPAPDAVFIGGGFAAAREAATALRPARIVAAFAAVERAAAAPGLLAADGYEVDGALVSSARLAPLPGGGRRLAPANPVFLIWAARAEGVGAGRPGADGPGGQARAAGGRR